MNEQEPGAGQIGDRVTTVLGIILALVVFVALYVRAGEQPGRRVRQGVVMSYPTSVAVVAGLFSWGFILLFAVLAALPVNRNGGNLVVTAMGLGATIVAPAMWFWCEVRGRVLLLTKRGLVQVRSHGARRRAQWHEVKRLSHNGLFDYYVVTTTTTVLIVPTWLRGQREFGERALEHIPPFAIECAEKLRGLRR